MNIYQVFTRLYGACKPAKNLPNGTIADNGVAKFNEFTADTLQRIKDYGFTHVWFTGVLEHATKTDYTRYGIHLDHPWNVKGRAGSPYAIKDYFDVDPDLAEDVPNRMAEFEALLERTHKTGLKLVIDFVPNHVARSYHSDVAPKGFEDLGVGDDEELETTSIIAGVNHCIRKTLLKQRRVVFHILNILPKQLVTMFFTLGPIVMIGTKQ